MEVLTVAKKVRDAFTAMGRLMEPRYDRIPVADLVAMSVESMPSTLGQSFPLFFYL